MKLLTDKGTYVPGPTYKGTWQGDKQLNWHLNSFLVMHTAEFAIAFLDLVGAPIASIGQLDTATVRRGTELLKVLIGLALLAGVCLAELAAPWSPWFGAAFTVFADGITAA